LSRESVCGNRMFFIGSIEKMKDGLLF